MLQGTACWFAQREFLKGSGYVYGGPEYHDGQMTIGAIIIVLPSGERLQTRLPTIASFVTDGLTSLYLEGSSIFGDMSNGVREKVIVPAWMIGFAVVGSNHDKL